MSSGTTSSWKVRLTGALLALSMVVLVGAAPASAAPVEQSVSTAEDPGPGVTGFISEDHTIKVCAGVAGFSGCVTVTIDDDNENSAPRCLPVSCNGGADTSL